MLVMFFYFLFYLYNVFLFLIYVFVFALDMPLSDKIEKTCYMPSEEKNLRNDILLLYDKGYC